MNTPSALEQAVLFLLDMEEYTGEDSETAHFLSMRLLNAIRSQPQQIEVDTGQWSPARLQISGERSITK